jgi:hypothetical protein
MIYDSVKARSPAAYRARTNQWTLLDAASSTGKSRLRPICPTTNWGHQAWNTEFRSGLLGQVAHIGVLRSLKIPLQTKHVHWFIEGLLSERGAGLHEDPNILEPWPTSLAHTGHHQFNARLPYVISPGRLRVYQNSQISIVVPIMILSPPEPNALSRSIPSSGNRRERCV